MYRWFLSIVTFLIITTNVSFAETLASVMKGQVVANNPEGVRVVVTESDGSILDIVDTNKAGVFKLDLSVMDTPSQSEVMKLNLQVRGSSGEKKTVSVSRYVNVFADTVLLRPIPLN